MKKFEDYENWIDKPFNFEDWKVPLELPQEEFNQKYCNNLKEDPKVRGAEAAIEAFALLCRESYKKGAGAIVIPYWVSEASSILGKERVVEINKKLGVYGEALKNWWPEEVYNYHKKSKINEEV